MKKGWDLERANNWLFYLTFGMMALVFAFLQMWEAAAISLFAFYYIKKDVN